MDEPEKNTPGPPTSAVPAEAGETSASGPPPGRREPAGPTIDDPTGPSGAETRPDEHHASRASSPGPTAPTIDEDGAPAAPPRPLPEIPGYEVLEELGRGGMGVVYKARHLRLHRFCALKMVRSGPLASSEALVRFLAEAESVARLRHPHIVTIHHIGEHDGLPFIELEYLPGGSLDDRLDGTPLPPLRAAGLVATLADAVQAAHEAGVVHRDLKPANVLLDESDAPRVADFGVAKALGSDTGLTATDSILGSPSYMAPEQAGGRSRDVGPPADVYALGAILYELLTGRPPFRAPSVLETLEQLRTTEPVAPSRLVPGLPRDLETICLKCLEKPPERRYGSARALAEELGRFDRGEPIEARPISPIGRAWRWCGRNRLVASLLSLLALVFVAGFVGVSSQWLRAERQRLWAERQSERLRRRDYINRVNLALREFEGNNVGRALELLEDCPKDLQGWEWEYVNRQCHLDLQTFQEPGPAVNAVAFSPDGTQIVCGSGDYKDNVDAVGTVVIRDLGTGEIVFERSDLPGGVRSVAFSPDGRFIAVGFGPRLGVWDWATGTERFPVRIEPDVRAVQDLEFSPDGTTILVGFGAFNTTEGGHARLLDASTGAAIGAPSVRLEPYDTHHVAFRSGGRQVVLSAHDRVEVHARDALDRPPLQSVRPHEPEFGIVDMALSPDGQLVATVSADRTARLTDLETGETRPALEGHEGFVRAVAFSPDGRRLVTGGEDRLIKLWDVDTGRELATFRGHAHYVHSVAFSPDGYRIASGGMDGTAKLWFASPRLQLIQDRHLDWVSIAFSPDGGSVASTGASDRDPLRSPIVWDESSGELIWSSARAIPNLAIAFGPEGRRIAAGGRDGRIRVWDLGSGDEPLVIEARGGAVHTLAFSPDGRWLASGGVDGIAALWDAKTGGRLDQELAPPDARPRLPYWNPMRTVFSRDDAGRFLAVSDGLKVVRVWDRMTGRLVGEPIEHEYPVLGLAFHPHAPRLAIVGGESPGTGSICDIWDLSTGKKETLVGHNEAIWCVTFSPDGRRIATGGDDRTIKLWDTSTGEEVFTLRGHTSGVYTIAFSPDGRRLVSGSIDMTARVWDLDPPSLDTLYRREAVALLWSHFDRHRNREAVLEAIRSDDSLREPMRGVALDVAEKWPISPDDRPVEIRPDPAR